MDLANRFFGKGVPRPGELPVANGRLVEPPGLAVLFPEHPDFDADSLTLSLRDYHPDLAAATAELLNVPPRPGDDSEPSKMGLIGWGRHVVKLVAFHAPTPKEALEACVHPAHYAPEIKDAAYQHAAHVLLFYAGYETNPHEQHVALAAAAAAISRFGAIVVLNETARMSVPAVVLLPHEEDNGDMLTTLRTLPIPFLYAGFVKCEIDGVPGIWMRTYGCHALKLPDLAFHATSHQQGTATFNLFSSMLSYLRDSGRSFTPGDTMNVGDGLFLRLRARTTEEWFLESPGEMFVAEPVNPEEANS